MTAAVLVLVLAALLVTLERQLTGSVDQALLSQLEVSQTLLADGDLAALEAGQYVQLSSPQGALLASSPALPDTAVLAERTTSCPGQSFARREVATPGSGADALRVVTACLPDGRLLAVGRSVDAQEEATERLLKLLLVAVPVLLALVAVVVGRSVRAALRPVDVLAREAAQISDGPDTSRRLPAVVGNDEIARLARTLDDMLARLAVAFAREQSFVDDASHELRTPIAVLRGEVELALSDLSDTAEVERCLRAASSEAERLSRLAEDLLVLARHRAGRSPTDTSDVAGVLEQTRRRLARAAAVEVAVQSPPEMLVRMPPADLERVLANLVTNAVAAGARTVHISAAASPQAQADVVLLVEDDGPGFPTAFLPTAFERFTRADAARTRTAGAGLGLAIVHALVTACGGDVSADNASALGGAAVRITLPTGSDGPVRGRSG